jgi:hypothetical protein
MNGGRKVCLDKERDLRECLESRIRKKDVHGITAGIALRQSIRERTKSKGRTPEKRSTVSFRWVVALSMMAGREWKRLDAKLVVITFPANCSPVMGWLRRNSPAMICCPLDISYNPARDSRTRGARRAVL